MIKVWLTILLTSFFRRYMDFPDLRVLTCFFVFPGFPDVFSGKQGWERPRHETINMHGFKKDKKQVGKVLLTGNFSDGNHQKPKFQKTVFLQLLLWPP